MENSQLPRFNAKWRDPKFEDIDYLHLPIAAGQREANYYNPPWDALLSLCPKLHHSGAAPTVIAPYWPHKPWFQKLHNMGTETIQYPATFDLLFPDGKARAKGSDD
jgi:hypothetical protein